MQKVHRQKLPPDELDTWTDTLKDYSFQEFDRAMKYLIRNPPKYDPGDGSMQVWSGMPKLPDVVRTMLDFRDEDIRVANARESQKRIQEDREMEKYRAEHPEEFVALDMADILKQATKAMEERTVNVPRSELRKTIELMDDEAWERRRQYLKAQAESIAKRYAGDKK